MRNPVFAVAILPKMELSKKALDLVEEQETKEIDSTFNFNEINGRLQ